MNTQIKSIGTFLICLLLLGGIFISPVSAIEYGGIGGKPANPDPANPRTKSIFIFTLNPGDRDSDELLVVNNTEEEKTLLVYATDSQRSSDGSFACEQLSDTQDNVGSWIKLDKEEITLEPLTNDKIRFTIEAPDNVSVGEENGCILIQEKKEPSSEGSGVSLSFRTGLRVVVNIPGEQIRELNLSEFNIETNDTLFLTKVSVENSGNVSIDANVKVLFNGLLGTTYQEIYNTYPILRGDTSTYNFEVNKPYWGGFIYVTTTVDYDNSQSASVGVDPENNENVLISSETKTMFVVPQLPALIIEIVVIVLIILLIVLIVKRLRKEKHNLKTWTSEYIVKEGEDIELIAKEFKLRWKDIAKYNKLTPPYSLKTGQRILLKKV